MTDQELTLQLQEGSQTLTRTNKGFSTMIATRIILAIFSLAPLLSHAGSNFLFQSLQDVDQYIIIDRDIKKPTLIISIPEPCKDCEALKPFLNDYLSDKKNTDLIVTVGTPLWRKAKDMIDRSPWVTPSLKGFFYNDPSARYRKSINAQEIQLVLLTSNGKVKKTTPFSSTIKYEEFMGERGPR